MKGRLRFFKWLCLNFLEFNIELCLPWLTHRIKVRRCTWCHIGRTEDVLQLFPGDGIVIALAGFRHPSFMAPPSSKICLTTFEVILLESYHTDYFPESHSLMHNFTSEQKREGDCKCWVDHISPLLQLCCLNWKKNARSSPRPKDPMWSALLNYFSPLALPHILIFSYWLHPHRSPCSFRNVSMLGLLQPHSLWIEFQLFLTDFLSSMK